jgi:hypothetical protein
MRKHGVRCLLMGGQACVFYGAAEFSRDIDLALLADSENIKRLGFALRELQVDLIAVPPMDMRIFCVGMPFTFVVRHLVRKNSVSML